MTINRHRTSLRLSLAAYSYPAMLLHSLYQVRFCSVVSSLPWPRRAISFSVTLTSLHLMHFLGTFDSHLLKSLGRITKYLLLRDYTQPTVIMLSTRCGTWWNPDIWNPTMFSFEKVLMFRCRTFFSNSPIIWIPSQIIEKNPFAYELYSTFQHIE